MPVTVAARRPSAPSSPSSRSSVYTSSYSSSTSRYSSLSRSSVTSFDLASSRYLSDRLPSSSLSARPIRHGSTSEDVLARYSTSRERSTEPRASSSSLASDSTSRSREREGSVTKTRLGLDSSSPSSTATSTASSRLEARGSAYTGSSSKPGRPPLHSSLSSSTTEDSVRAAGTTYARSRTTPSTTATMTTSTGKPFHSRFLKHKPVPGEEKPAEPSGAGAGSDKEDNYESPRLGRRAPSTANGTRGSGLNGLRNIGNTCFMNSVIQCLSNTRPLLEYLLKQTYLSEINTTNSSMKGALMKAFAKMIEELWTGEGQVINTSAFKGQIQHFAPRFMGYSQQDAQEFLRYLLEGLHEDVNRVEHRPTNTVLPDIEDSLSDNQKADESWRRYLRIDNSSVVDAFVGQLKSTLQCTVCGHCSVTFDPFWDLSLPIPSRTGQLRLQQCLEHFTREEVLDGDEKPTCAKCQTRRKCTKSFSIQKFPKILVLHLKRFSPMERFRGKLNCTVEFPLTGLDLSAYAANRGRGCTYNLYGIANHSGTTYSGHYTAYCKHPYTHEWHEYNDSRVSGISSRSVVSSEAYVLFYELSGHTSHL